MQFKRALYLLKHNQRSEPNMICSNILFSSTVGQRESVYSLQRTREEVERDGTPSGQDETTTR